MSGLKMGFIGHGGITGSHRSGYNTLNNEGFPISIDAVCDIRPEKLENIGEARAYGSIQDFFDGEEGKLDFVDICLPTFLHADTAIEAMERGFHVLVEKPMALTYEDCVRMCETAKHTGKTLMVAQCCRFGNFATAARDYIKKGIFGKPKTACLKRDGGTPRWSWNDWFLKEELSGGAILDLHVHDVDMMQDFFGIPEAVSSGASRIIPGDGPDIISTNYYYSNGLFTHSTSDWTTENNMYYGSLGRIDFEGGYIISASFAGQYVFAAVPSKGDIIELNTVYAPNDFYTEEIRYFTRCIKEGLPVDMCTPESSAHSIRIALAEKESAERGGERITL